MISNDIILFGRHLIPVWWNDWQAIQVPYLQKRAIGVNPKSSQDYRWWMRSSFKIKRIGRFQSPTLMAVRSRHRQRNNSSIIWRCRFFSSFQNEINFIQKWKTEYERETWFHEIICFFHSKTTNSNFRPREGCRIILKCCFLPTWLLDRVKTKLETQEVYSALRSPEFNESGCESAFHRKMR